MLNASMRALTLHIDAFQSQFLRYFFGLVVLLPVILHGGVRLAATEMGTQFTRGAVHTLGLCMWFSALPRIPLADMTAIGFTGPIFIMIGAWWFFKEPMRWERWLATAIGFAGVMIVVAPSCRAAAAAGPPADAGLGTGVCRVVPADQGDDTQRAPGRDPGVAVDQRVDHQPAAGAVELAVASAGQWAGFLLCGVLGSAGHYCLTRSFVAADISATQSAKFLDLVWSALMGWLLFTDIPSASTLIGGVVICAATIWVAQRESRSHRRLAEADAGASP